jgi:hypothetical protein
MRKREKDAAIGTGGERPEETGKGRKGPCQNLAGSFNEDFSNH